MVLFFMVKKTYDSHQLDLTFELDTTELDSRVILLDNPAFTSQLAVMAKTDTITVDIETANNVVKKGNGLDWSRGDIRLIQVYLKESDICLVVDLWENNPNIDLFIKVLGKQLANPNTKILGHNIYFDLCFLQSKYGFKAVNIRDSRVLSQVLWCGVKSHRHSLAEVAGRLFSLKVDKSKQLSNWNNPKLSNSQLNYAALDVVLTYRCVCALSKKLMSFNNTPSIFGEACDNTLVDIALTECNVIPAFVEITLTGMPVNLEACKKAIAKYTEALEDLYKPVKEKLNLPFTASSKKLVLAIYDAYGIWMLEPKTAKELLDLDSDEEDEDEVKQLTFTGSLFKDKEYPKIPVDMKLTTSSANLFRYYIDCNEEHLLILSLTRSLKKVKDALEALYLSAKQNGGRARTSFSTLGNTGTGRSTSGGNRASSMDCLNLQNLPNPVEHPLLDKYNLPVMRDCIVPEVGRK
jgi:hypothetical protein